MFYENDLKIETDLGQSKMLFLKKKVEVFLQTFNTCYQKNDPKILMENWVII